MDNQHALNAIREMEPPVKFTEACTKSQLKETLKDWDVIGKFHFKINNFDRYRVEYECFKAGFH
jgi:hypothetical protein